jgi:hypothetical protein
VWPTVVCCLVLASSKTLMLAPFDLWDWTSVRIRKVRVSLTSHSVLPALIWFCLRVLQVSYSLRVMDRTGSFRYHSLIGTWGGALLRTLPCGYKLPGVYMGFTAHNWSYRLTYRLTCASRNSVRDPSRNSVTGPAAHNWCAGGGRP